MIDLYVPLETKDFWWVWGFASAPYVASYRHGGEEVRHGIFWRGRDSTGRVGWGRECPVNAYCKEIFK